MTEEEQKQALLALLQDSESFEKLNKWTSRFNIFDVLKISRTEIRHSNVLAWLMDPNENHSLGDKFLYGVLAKLSGVSGTSPDLFLKLLSSDLSSFVVFREWNHIDLLLTSQELKVAIAIENKIGSQEHNAGNSNISQLEKYHKKLLEKFLDYQLVEVFLTPGGTEATQNNWIVLTYQNIIDVLAPVFEDNKGTIEEAQRILIENYISIVKNEVIMDHELSAICKEIYRKHKAALDLIYDFRNDISKQISDVCRNIVESIKDEKRIEIDPSSSKSYIKFSTPLLDNKFEKMSKEFYYYHFSITMSNGKVYAALQLIFHQLKGKVHSENVISTMNELIEKESYKIKSDKWEWKVANTFGSKNWEEFDEDEVSEWANESLKKLWAYESKFSE